jgi:hypothetical protein
VSGEKTLGAARAAGVHPSALSFEALSAAKKRVTAMFRRVNEISRNRTIKLSHTTAVYRLPNAK